MNTKIDEKAKGAFIEKLLFAILPLLVGATTHLLASLSSLQKEVTILDQKISIAVSTDNKQIPSSASELAREKLKEELKKEIQENRDQISLNRLHISLLEQKVKGESSIKKEK